MITVYCEDAAPDVKAIVDIDQSLLIDRGVIVARGTAHFKKRQSNVLVTHVTEEYQHFINRAAVAFLEETQVASDVIAVATFNAHLKIP